MTTQFVRDMILFKIHPSACYSTTTRSLPSPLVAHIAAYWRTHSLTVTIGTSGRLSASLVPQRGRSCSRKTGALSDVVTLRYRIAVLQKQLHFTAIPGLARLPHNDDGRVSYSCPQSTVQYRLTFLSQAQSRRLKIICHHRPQEQKCESIYTSK